MASFLRRIVGGGAASGNSVIVDKQNSGGKGKVQKMEKERSSINESFGAEDGFHSEDIQQPEGSLGDEDDPRHLLESKPVIGMGPGKGKGMSSGNIVPQDDEDEDEDEDEGGEDYEKSSVVAPGGDSTAYDPEEFRNLEVSSEIKSLFDFIADFKPNLMELETQLKPFIPEFIPAVGDIDAFIKIPRPDEIEDNLGLLVLDEPSAKQSDPTVVNLHLRSAAKNQIPKDLVAKKLPRADKNPKEIEQWIKSIGELHRSQPATSVHYSKPMPDIETLMQEWPPELEELLKEIDLPTADMEIPLEQFVDIVCTILDIPVQKSRIQALHVLFTLYSEFKNSQHFKALAEGNQLDNATKENLTGADRVEI